MGGHVGTSTSTAYMSEQFYADRDGRWFIMMHGGRHYLSIQQITERAKWERRWGHRLRVRVKARSEPWEEHT